MFDSYTKQKTIEDLYEYHAEGVRNLLSNYHKLVEEGSYSYDPMALVIRMDIDRALRSTLLTSDHLNILALHYALQFSFMEIQLYEGTQIEEAMDIEAEAIQILVKVLDGEPTMFYQYEDLLPSGTLSEYLAHVGTGKASPYDVSDMHLTQLLHLTQKKDRLARQVLQQRVEGPPLTFSLDNKVSSFEEEYPSHKTSEALNGYDYFRNQDKKNMIYYDDLTNQAGGMRASGRKKVIVNSELLGNKGMVYQL
ncbi:hypothetical protein ABE073_00220 [Lederbergia citrisecunda]|uniref:hypothetical protein n=1 Tax=Lederbergia citrisecunda TaxID=2833583 RepID=UPI003D2E4685